MQLSVKRIPASDVPVYNQYKIGEEIYSVPRIPAPEAPVYNQFKIGDEIYSVPRKCTPMRQTPPSAATLARGPAGLAPVVPRKPKRGMVPWSNFNVLKKQLGKGSFGEVYLGYIWSDRLECWQQAAIKVLKRTYFDLVI